MVEPGTRRQDCEVDAAALRALLADVVSGALSADEAVARLSRLPFADLGFARVDHHRALRQGLPEAVYAPGKTPEQVAAIVAELVAGDDSPVVLTRADADHVKAALAVAPNGVVRGTTVVWRRRESPRADTIVIVTAGTSDLPVAEECATVLEAHGWRPARINDAGVAGLHRLLPHVDEFAAADVVIAIAGMEGALASVVGGVTSAPVIAVPTSTGYGSALEGITALLAMLASCASGVTVVGIDNGFGAACAAARICMTSGAKDPS
jgi:NCAIR mutase (PurE)-related protein